MIQALLFSIASVACLTLIVYGAIISSLPMWLSGLLGYFFGAPILLDLLFTLFGCCLRSYYSTSSSGMAPFPKMPSRFRTLYQLDRYLVYSKNYDLTFCGLEKCHPAETTKYSKSFKFAISSQGQDGAPLFNRRLVVHRTHTISRAQLLDAGISACKLILLNYVLYILKAVEIPLFFMPASLLRWRILQPMLQGTQGTVDACLFALNTGWCINLSGGYHHATRSTVGGFCVYPDISVGIHFARKWGGIQKVLIIDLDAHQGNGHERDFMNDPYCYIIDAYNPHIYPGDMYAREKIDGSIKVSPNWDDAKYLHQVDQHLTNALETFTPELVVYNAGTDCMENDPLGGLSITAQGIVRRDELVFTKCWEKKVPIAMVLSGGYQARISQVIGESVVNIFNQAKDRGLIRAQRDQGDQRDDADDHLLARDQ